MRNGDPRGTECLMQSLRLAVVLLVPLTLSSIAHAWGAEGHRLIAELAESQLTPSARAEVNRLLAAEPSATISSVATWSDEIRSPATARWHYVNLPRWDCDYDRSRDCANDDCAVEALTRQVATLGSKASDSQRLTALKWVIHLVGDLHQPLHASFKADKGGNQYQVQAFGRGTNLHALWDGSMIRNRPGGADALRRAASTTDAAKPEVLRPADWAVESCKIVAMPGFYPEARRVDQHYVDQWDPVLVSRLRSAAKRLANTLNETLR